MKPSRVETACRRLACLTGLVLSLAVLVPPAIAAAADVPSEGDNAAAASGPVVLRGTRPVSAAPAQAPKAASERNQIPAPYMGFVPAPLSGSGWNTDYNTEGLSYTPNVSQ